MDNVQNLFRARMLLMDYLEEHEKTCQKPGCQERENAVAFLGHAAGLKGGVSARTLVTLLAFYESECKENACIHVGDDPAYRRERVGRLIHPSGFGRSSVSPHKPV